MVKEILYDELWAVIKFSLSPQKPKGGDLPSK